MSTPLPRTIPNPFVGPVKLRRDFTRSSLLGALPFLVLGLAVIVATLVQRGLQLYQITEEQRIWEEGEDAGQSATRGQKFTRYSYFYEYDIEVIYNDAEKNIYHRPMVFSALKTPIDQEVEPKVRYDPNDPGAYAVSWGIDQIGPRLWAIALFGGFWVLVGALLTMLGMSRLRFYTDAKKFAAEPTLLLLPVAEVLTPKEDADLVYKYRYQSNGKTKENEVSGPAGNEGPFLVRAEQLFLVALVAPNKPERHVLLRQDLYPLSLGAEEASVAQQQILSSAGAPS